MLEVEALPATGAAAVSAPTDEKIRQRLDRWKDDLARDLWVEECAKIVQDMAKAR